MGKIDISVIVPVYNVEKYLPRCIESVLAQTYKNFELILVDDGSPDKSGEICDEYAKKDSRIKVIHKENGGVSSARNAGIDAAKGEYIAFIDSDDYVEPTMYEKLINKMNDEVDIVFCYLQSVFIDGKISFSPDDNIKNIIDKPWDIKPYLTWGFEVRGLDGKIVKPCGVSACTSVFKKRIIDEFSLSFSSGIKMGEDRLFMISYLNRCKKGALVEEALYNYRKNRTESATANFLKVYCDLEHEKKRLLLRIKVICDNPKFSEEEKNHLIKHFKQEFFYMYSSMIKKDAEWKDKMKKFYQDEEVNTIRKEIKLKDLIKMKRSLKTIFIMFLLKNKMFRIYRSL